jgi:hypothetical protein
MGPVGVAEGADDVNVMFEVADVNRRGVEEQVKHKKPEPSDPRNQHLKRKGL